MAKGIYCGELCSHRGYDGFRQSRFCLVDLEVGSIKKRVISAGVQRIRIDLEKFSENQELRLFGGTEGAKHLAGRLRLHEFLAERLILDHFS